MAKQDWNRKGFHFFGGYLTYTPTPGVYDSTHVPARFVARFKYTKKDRAPFQKFLIENFTPEEYFSRLKVELTPYTILESKGFMFPRMKEYYESKAK